MMSKKIIHQLSLSAIGGVQRSFIPYLLYVLKKSNFHHSVYSKHDLLDQFIEVKNYHNNINKSLISKIKFIFFLISKKYIIHFYNNLGSSSVNKLLKFIPYSNIIFHERGGAWTAKDKDIKMYKSNALKAEIILANSNASKIMLIKRFGIDKRKIKVIYNGFLSKDFKFVPKDNNRYSEKLSVGYAGRLDTFKGVNILLESAKKLPKYDFFIAGEGALGDILKKSVNNYKNIHFLGNVKEPLDFISKMDIIVTPSIREPLGNIIIESGYCKKAVIASNVDGIPEIIVDGVSGILINPDKKILFNSIPNNASPMPEVVIDPNTRELTRPKEIDPLKLCESIVLLASSSNMRRLYGENLYKTVIEKFNIENYHESVEKIYENLLEK